MATNEAPRTSQVFGCTACESTTSSNIRDPVVQYSTQIVAGTRRSGRLIRAYSATSASTRVTIILYRCRPALLIGINAFSKAVHIITTVSEEAAPLCVSNTSNESPPLLHELLIGTVPLHLSHCCVYDVCTNGQDAQGAPNQLQVEPANTASSSSSVHVVHEAAAAHACTQISTATQCDEDAGGGNDCINIVTLHNVWRLTATAYDSGNTDSLDDLFMIPIEESLIGQQSSSHELVIDYTYQCAH